MEKIWQNYPKIPTNCTFFTKKYKKSIEIEIFTYNLKKVSFNFEFFLGPEPEEEVSEAEEASKEVKASKKEAVEAENDLKKEEVEPESDDEDQLVIFFLFSKISKKKF